jgi:PAS domain S-box-containing protein
MTIPSPSAAEAPGPDIQADTDIIDLLDESVIVMGLDMHVRAWNAEAERLYGWKREEVIGGKIQAAVKCSPNEPLKVILAKVQETGLWRGEFSRTTKQGKTVTVKAKWSLRRSRNGEIADIVETSRDVTEARQTEESLERAQHHYQNLFHASAASFWELEFSAVGKMLKDLKDSGVKDFRKYFSEHPDYVRQMIQATRIVDVNDITLAMFGNGNREELLQNRLDAFWPDESLGVYAESVLASLEKKPHYSAETVFRSLDGRHLETLFTVSFPPHLLQYGRFLVGIVDLTQAKKAKAEQEASERRYRDLFHFLPVPLLRLEGTAVIEIFKSARAEGVVDFAQYLKERPELQIRLMDGLKVVEVNQRTVEMLRGGSAEEFNGSVTRYWTESMDDFRHVIAARYSGKPGFECLTKMTAHDGTVLDMLFFAAYGPVTGAENISLVGLIDVSDRVKAQEMLARVQGEMAHAARVSVLGELTASIAHEVAQPLTAIESNTEASLTWLRHSPPNIEEVRELSIQTAAEVQRAADIIHRVRSMALRAAPEHEDIEVNTVIREAMLFLRHEFERNEVKTCLNLATDIPAILADRVQLQQVIVNLAVNAMQAMAQGKSSSREVYLTTAVTADSRSVTIEVEDTGPGISKEALQHLFESFFTTKSTGMGMGLPICRSIIEAHGGQISVGNRASGNGARFSILLPTHRAISQ